MIDIRLKYWHNVFIRHPHLCCAHLFWSPPPPSPHPPPRHSPSSSCSSSSPCFASKWKYWILYFGKGVHKPLKYLKTTDCIYIEMYLSSKCQAENLLIDTYHTIIYTFLIYNICIYHCIFPIYVFYI